MITINIVTVTYNNARGLEETLDSIKYLKERARNNFNLNLIVIDNLSTDNTSEILKTYSDTIDILVSDRDRGIYDAMNKGITIVFQKGYYKAKDSWLIFMNSGDRFYFDKILKVDFKAHNKLSVLIGKNLKDDVSLDIRFSQFAFYSGIMPFCHQSTLYNLNILTEEELKYNLVKIYGDYLQLFRIHKKYNIFLYLNETISCYEQATTTGLSRSDNRFRIEKYKIIINELGILGVLKALYFKVSISYRQSLLFTNDFKSE